MKYKFKDYFLRKILIATKPKFNLITKYQSNQEKIMILDIGVANSSVKEDKIVFPRAKITALDYLILDKSLADEFIHFDLDSNQPLPILSKYDIVIFNHVIEHIKKWKLNSMYMRYSITLVYRSILAVQRTLSKGCMSTGEKPPRRTKTIIRITKSGN
jgi:hypothetical protein